MRLQVFFIILLNFLPIVAIAQNRAFFTPSLDCENNIIAQIHQSTKTIDVAVYAINNDAIVEALIDADRRGVKVRILTDRLQAGQKKSRVKDLEAAGVPLKRHRKYKVQHDKFAVFDGKTAVTGSYNWTNSASQKNAENCFFFNDRTVTDYAKRFKQLWQINQSTS